MIFSVEAWSPEYGVSADASQLADHAMSVDLDVEVPASQWEPLRAPPVAGLPNTIFVDGVRRIDARIWVTDGDTTRPGVCASVAAGAVLCTQTEARVVEVLVSRSFYSAPFTAAADIESRHGSYGHVPCISDSPEDIYLGIHEQMTKLESSIDISNVAGSAGVDTAPEELLVVFDGPLRGRPNLNDVGYIKTQHVQYLPDEQQSLLGCLSPAQRSPLFRIDGSRFGKFSWYLRLPSAQTHPLAGIVRCEVSCEGDVEAATYRANQTCATLPRYASAPYRESRAPQNLYPIAGLESHLRHRLGDQELMQRALRRVAS